MNVCVNLIPLFKNWYGVKRGSIYLRQWNDYLLNNTAAGNIKTSLIVFWVQ